MIVPENSTTKREENRHDCHYQANFRRRRLMWTLLWSWIHRAVAAAVVRGEKRLTLVTLKRFAEDELSIIAASSNNNAQHKRKCERNYTQKKRGEEEKNEVRHEPNQQHQNMNAAWIWPRKSSLDRGEKYCMHDAYRVVINNNNRREVSTRELTAFTYALFVVLLRSGDEF